MQAALAWSCAMQECMMVQEWPMCVLKDPFREGRDRSGNLIFRGPRWVRTLPHDFQRPFVTHCVMHSILSSVMSYIELAACLIGA
eukprot:1161712-Pelagomonas_calceolata.AAC.15